VCVVALDALVDEVEDVLFNHRGLGAGRVPAVRVSVRSHQPFGEVPGDVVVADGCPRDVCAVGDQTHRCRASRL